MGVMLSTWMGGGAEGGLSMRASGSDDSCQDELAQLGKKGCGQCGE